MTFHRVKSREAGNVKFFFEDLYGNQIVLSPFETAILYKGRLTYLTIDTPLNEESALQTVHFLEEKLPTYTEGEKQVLMAQGMMRLINSRRLIHP